MTMTVCWCVTQVPHDYAHTWARVHSAHVAQGAGEVETNLVGTLVFVVIIGWCRCRRRQ